MSRPMRVVVIGAGIMGLATAHHLAERGGCEVLVVDRAYVGAGASGRNGGGVRAQFSTVDNIRLMQESLAICRDFATRLRINVWFRQGGYLFLARTAERARTLAGSVSLQNECGLPTRMLDPREARRMVPELDLQGVVAASFNPRDGVVFPWPFLWGYARAARAHGVTILPYTAVTALDLAGDRIRRVQLRPTRPGEVARGEVAPAAGAPRWVDCDEVVLCAGAWSPEIARMAGVDLPTRPHRHEICSTEALKPWLGPLVSDLTDGLYFSQSGRGEIVGGIGIDPVPPGVDQRSSRQFLAAYARALVRLVPRLAGVQVLRQWAGCYDLPPDGTPIVGRAGRPVNLTLASGFMGHGFMMAPVMGRRLAEHVLTGRTDDLFARWSLQRFATGTQPGEALVIG